MKKTISAIILSILILAAGSGIWDVPKAAAAGTLNIILNGQALQFDRTSAYTKEGTVMLPLREVAEALKYKASYQTNTGTVVLSRVQEQVEFKVGTHELVLNQKDKVSFTQNVESKQGRIYVPLSFFEALGLIAIHDQGGGKVELYSPDVMAAAIAGLLAKGSYQELGDRYFKTAMGTELVLTQARQSWEVLAGPAGPYFGVKAATTQSSKENLTIQSVLSFANSEASLTITLDKSGNITALRLEPLAAVVKQ